MDLKAFVSQTLTQIVEGVVDSAARISELGGAVSPAYGPNGSDHIGQTLVGHHPVHAVNFDVALIVSNASMQGATEILTVATVASSKSVKDAGTSEELSSRIRFSVPLQLPTDPKSAAGLEEARRVLAAKQAQQTAKIRRSTPTRL